jgi:hypothetical protein
VLLFALMSSLAVAQDEPTIVMEQGEVEPARWGSTVTGRTQVHLWPVTGTRTNGEDREDVDELYVALDVGGGFRATWLVTDGISLGGEAGYGLVLGPFGGTAGLPFGAGIDLGPIVGLGADGVHADQLPVGLVVGVGARLDLLYLTGLGTSGRDPVVVVPRPFGSAELFVHLPGVLVGLRGEWVLPGRARYESLGTVSELRIGRYGGGVVFNLPF